jgi:hypothetical protein
VSELGPALKLGYIVAPVAIIAFAPTEPANKEKIARDRKTVALFM